MFAPQARADCGRFGMMAPDRFSLNQAPVSFETLQAAADFRELRYHLAVVALHLGA